MEQQAKNQFHIPEENFSVLQAKLEKLNRRGVKLGCEPIVLNVLREESRELTRTLPSGYEIKFVQRYIIAEVTGQSPILNGWKFVAKVERTEAGILTNNMPGEEVPHRYRDNQGQCEHCNHNRKRTRLYIVRNDAGEYKQVGVTCLRDFLGHKNPEAIASFLECLFQPSELIDDEIFGGGGGGYLKPEAEMLTVLTIAHSIITMCGYVTRAESEVHKKDSTSSQVHDILFPPKHLFERGNEYLRQKYEDFTAKVRPNDADKAAAAEALVWMQQLNATSDYLNNLKVLSNLKSIKANRIGIAASGVWAWMKEVQKKTKQLQQLGGKSGDHVGEAGKRDELVLILKDVQIKSGMYEDELSLVKFEDEAGNDFVWWTSAMTVEKDGVHWKGQIFELGTKLKLRATVKRHSEFKGRKTTTLNRCFLVETVKGEA